MAGNFILDDNRKRQENAMPEMNRQVLLKRRPNGMPVTDDFAIVEGPLLEPDDGEVLLRGIYLSLDPYMRGRISGQRSYATPTKIDDVIEGRVVGQVMLSAIPVFGKATSPPAATAGRRIVSSMATR